MRNRPFNAALHRLVMAAERPADREKRRIFPIRQQHPRPLD
jgi:hypothetical protein